MQSSVYLQDKNNAEIRNTREISQHKEGNLQQKNSMHFYQNQEKKRFSTLSMTIQYIVLRILATAIDD